MKTDRYCMITVLCLALACLPTCALSAEDLPGLQDTLGQAAKKILSEPSLVRESKLLRMPIDQKQLEFLIDNPHAALALAHLYAPFLDKYAVEVRPDRVVHIEDPGTLAGDAELIETRPGRRIYLISGYYDILGLRFNGDMLLITIYSEHRENAAVTTNATVIAYVKINSTFAGALAWLADYLFPKKVDERIEQIVRAARMITAEVQKDPKVTYEKLKASGEVSAEELEGFCRTFCSGDI